MMIIIIVNICMLFVCFLHVIRSIYFTDEKDERIDEKGWLTLYEKFEDWCAYLLYRS